jgi:hypothetical protein
VPKMGFRQCRRKDWQHRPSCLVLLLLATLVISMLHGISAGMASTRRIYVSSATCFTSCGLLACHVKGLSIGYRYCLPRLLRHTNSSRIITALQHELTDSTAQLLQPWSTVFCCRPADLISRSRTDITGRWAPVWCPACRMQFE